MSRLQPLPIPVRVFHGESPQSYVRRLTDRNHLTLADFHAHLAQHGITSSSWRDPTRLDALRQLGGLDQHTFTAPIIVHGNLVTERPLCLHCCDGQHASGRVPHIGYRCHDWMPDAHDLLKPLGYAAMAGKAFVDDNPTTPPTYDIYATAAEHQFRQRLASRGILYDSYAMRIGLTLALYHHPRSYVLQSPLDRVYPRQVATAIELTRPDVVTALADPDVSHQIRARAIAMIIRCAATEARDLSRTPLQIDTFVSNRLWMLASRLQTIVKNARRMGQTPADPEFDLLRHATW